MKDYATFKRDGIVCKEEILFWRQTGSRPTVVRFLTPSGLYKYEQPLCRENDVKGIVKLPKVIENKFYKYSGTDEECYYAFGQIEKVISSRWERISNLESFTVSFPN